MTASKQQTIDFSKLRSEIKTWLKSRVDSDSFEWLAAKSEGLWNDGEDWEFFSSFSAVPRYTGKEDLDLTDDEQKRAETIRPGWEPGSWTIDQLGRTLIILSIENRDKKEFLELLEKTHQTSDMAEAEALYKNLPVMPYPEDLRSRAAEGIRSNMTSVFNAVAHRNPYPSEYFDDGAWNQMVLKALFVESPLYLIRKLDDRANRKLAEMLIDYAHERWAAGRNVSPELWRPVGPFAEGEILEDLKKALNKSDEIQRQAAALALSDSPSDEAQSLLQKHADLKNNVNQEKITWDDIGREFEKQK